MVVVLPEPLTPTTSDDERLGARDRKRLRHGIEHLLHLGGEDGLHLVGIDLLVVAAGGDRLADAGGGGDAEIGADQRVFQLLDHGGIEPALGDEIGDRAADRGRGAPQSGAQPLPPACPAGFGFLVGIRVRFVHDGGRDSGFAMTPEEMVRRVLYRDGLMLVIDKPAGMAVHRGPKGGESLEDHFDALRYGLPRAPALAHRLDRDTSGCLVLGRHRKALAELGRLFKAGRVGKTYWAVVEGGPEPTRDGSICRSAASTQPAAGG